MLARDAPHQQQQQQQQKQQQKAQEAPVENRDAASRLRNMLGKRSNSDAAAAAGPDSSTKLMKTETGEAVAPDAPADAAAAAAADPSSSSSSDAAPDGGAATDVAESKEDDAGVGNGATNEGEGAEAEAVDEEVVLDIVDEEEEEAPDDLPPVCLPAVLVKKADSPEKAQVRPSMSYRRGLPCFYFSSSRCDDSTTAVCAGG
jgi:hypothetical protein